MFLPSHHVHIPLFTPDLICIDGTRYTTFGCCKSSFSYNDDLMIPPLLIYSNSFGNIHSLHSFRLIMITLKLDKGAVPLDHD